jgi:hypothetical protein
MNVKVQPIPNASIMFWRKATLIAANVQRTMLLKGVVDLARTQLDLTRRAYWERLTLKSSCMQSPATNWRTSGMAMCFTMSIFADSGHLEKAHLVILQDPAVGYD